MLHFLYHKTFFISTNRGRYLIGLYTQLIWADTRYVGCGITMYRNRKNSSQYLKYFVCNYGPKGNIMGKSIYERGRPCSKCPNGCDKTRTNLCGPEIRNRNRNTGINHHQLTADELENKNDEFWRRINEFCEFYKNELVLNQLNEKHADLVNLKYSTNTRTVQRNKISG